MGSVPDMAYYDPWPNFENDDKIMVKVLWQDRKITAS